MRTLTLAVTVVVFASAVHAGPVYAGLVYAGLVYAGLVYDGPVHFGLWHDAVREGNQIAVQVVGISGAQSAHRYRPTNEIFLNPERGLYGYCPLTDPEIDHAALRISGVSLCYAPIVLDCCRSTPIGRATLAAIESNLTGLRAAGLKGIVRIVYDNTAAGEDTTLAWVEKHLKQLQPLLADNVDAIAFFQAGVIGAWGEWHSSRNDHNTPAGRAAVWRLLTAYLPANRFIQLRRPTYSHELEPRDRPLDDSTAFSGTGAARAGHHNDCWLASDTDRGTYASADDRAAWLDALAHDTSYVLWGAETCAPSPRANCATALAEGRRLHATYLNRDFHPDVITTLSPCWNEIKRHLGYRFELLSAELPTAVTPEQSFSYRIRLRNTGWAPPYNQRPAFLRVLASSRRVTSADPAVTVLTETPVSADPRFWRPETGTVELTGTVAIPADVDTSVVSLALWLPDPDSRLRSRPKYAIRFANIDVWDVAMGHNILADDIAVHRTDR